jgi:pimeloyl-ACP methyl ester carboxylesterase
LIVTPSVAAEEQIIEVDGLPIHYATAGTGPPLVLFHGAGDNALDWRWVMSTLARDHQIYAPDLPGSGASAKPAADRYSPEFFERFVAGFLDTLGIERAAMVGNSLGGLVALRLALSEPARVTALVLVDSAGLGRTVSPALQSLALPGYGKLAVTWSKTPPAPCRELWDGRCSSSRARGASPEVAQNAISAGPNPRLLGGSTGSGSSPGRAQGATRGLAGPTS